MSARPPVMVAFATLAATVGCGAPTAPADPTWADVQPILAGECTDCHGASAATTGSAYRFDFYEVTTDLCGEATQAVGADTPMAHALANDIWSAITGDPGTAATRPRMPPQPAPYLADWEWKTIGAWLNDGAPKGDLPRANRPARFRFFHAPASVDQTLDLTALVEDPDGDPVIGVLKIGDTTLKMDRAGSFSARVDTSAWTPGVVPITAVLCDGWSNVDYDVGTLTVSHR